MKTLTELVSEMQEEILDLVLAGTVPADVSSFGNLHDFIDANCLANVCEDAVFDEMQAHFGGRNEELDVMPEAMIDHLNAAQDAVNAWIMAGGIAEGIALRKSGT